MNETSLKKTGTNDLDDLCSALEQYFHNAVSVLENGRFSIRQAQELAASVEEVRMLLQELDHYLCSPARNGLVTPSISELRNCYFELEGIVKELRNDLCLPL